MPAKERSIKSDLRRVRALKDEDIDYSDIPELDDAWFETATVATPAKELISMRLDEDVLTFFREEGRGYQTRINAVLRAYMTHRTRVRPTAGKRRR